MSRLFQFPLTIHTVSALPYSIPLELVIESDPPELYNDAPLLPTPDPYTQDDEEVAVLLVQLPTDHVHGQYQPQTGQKKKSKLSLKK